MADLPLFYCPPLQTLTGTFDLDEETRRHVFTVLRMTAGEKIELSDGTGTSAVATIVTADKKRLTVDAGERFVHASPSKKRILAVSLLKNAARFEWLLEKLTEVGVTEIIPMLASRTERQHFRQERARQIVVSAALQSRQFHFPQLHEPKKFTDVLAISLPSSRLIAHCMEGEKRVLASQDQDAILLIGPEGDFTHEELDMAMAKGFAAVSLGDSRLRTETAGIVGAVMMR